MKRAWGVGVLAAGMMVACGGPDQDGGLVAPVPDGADCVRSGVDGVTCYPTEGIGRDARPASTNQRRAVLDAYGDRIPNLKFVGFRAVTPELPMDTTQGTTVVQLADYFDPKAEKYSLIVLNACAVWCDLCHQLADELASGVASAYAPKGVVILQAITAGLDYKPSTTADLESYAQGHRANFSILADPGERTLGIFDLQAPALPFLIVVDARTMEIVQYTTGKPVDLGRYFDRALATVHSRPPKP